MGERHDPKAFAVRIGRLIQNIRSDCGMNQTEVAEILGISRTQYCNLELGRSNLLLIHFDTLRRELEFDANEVLDFAGLPGRLAKKPLGTRMPRRVSAGGVSSC